VAPQPSPDEVAIDRIFADFQGAGQPGCVLGVERDGHAKGAPPRLRVEFFFGDVLEISRVAPWAPDARALAALEGEYASDEADARFLACMQDGKLVLLQGPERVVRIEPSYDGVFKAPEVGWLVTFRRTGGRVAGMDVGLGRMWRLPFARVGTGSCAERGRGGVASRATLR
jgi:hypothetical protein